MPEQIKLFPVCCGCGENMEGPDKYCAKCANRRKELTPAELNLACKLLLEKVQVWLQTGKDKSGQVYDRAQVLCVIKRTLDGEIPPEEFLEDKA